MNPTSTPPSSPIGPRQRRFRWRYVFLGMVGFVVLGIAALVLSFMPGAELRTLRRAAIDRSPDTWQREVEFGVGRLPVGLLQAGLAFLPLEPEARAALHCLRSADVGVYRVREGGPAPERDRIFADVRSAMEQRGWEPLVLVRDGRERVGIFLPTNPGHHPHALNLTIFVLDGSQLVMVSVRTDLEALATVLEESPRVSSWLSHLRTDSGHPIRTRAAAPNRASGFSASLAIERPTLDPLGSIHPRRAPQGASLPPLGQFLQAARRLE